METATMTNGQVRHIRDRELPKITQEEVARELGVSRYTYLKFERHGEPLPEPLTPSDAVEAIERIKRRRRDTNPDLG